MKKTLIAIVAIMLVLVLCFSLFACKDKNNTNNNTTNQTDTNKDKDKGKDKDKDKGQETAKVRTADDLGDYEAATDLMLIYADQYLTNKAGDSLDISSSLKKDINKKAAAIEGEPITSITVKLVDNTYYELTFTYKDKSTYVYSVSDGEGALLARTAEKGQFAGYTFADNGNSAEFLSSLATVYNAFLRTFQKAKAEGADFGEDYELAATGAVDAQGKAKAKGYTFGASVEAAFFLNYGVGEGQIGPISYGIKTYGTLGYAAEDTQVALEIIDESVNKPIIGLYYKDSTIYLAIDIDYTGFKRNADHKIVDASGAVIEDASGKIIEGKEPVKEKKNYKQTYYLDEADINAILGDVLGDYFSQPECVNNIDGKTYAAHSYKSGYCEHCGKLEPEASTGVPFYEHEPNYTSIKDALTDLTGGNTMVGTVIGMISGLFTIRTSDISNGTRYQYKIELGTLLDKLLGGTLGDVVSGALNPVTESILPQFDLGSFCGVGGDLVLTFDVVNGFDVNDASAQLLSGVQLSYNVAQKDFRWSKVDNEPKIYGPVNVAITVKDFDIGEKTVTIDNPSQYTYFSPLNGQITADINYADANDDSLDGDYKLIATAQFNPFTIFAGGSERAGAAEIILDKANGDPFAHVYMHNFTYSEDKGYDCTVTVLFNGKYYETLASQSDFFSKTFDEFIVPLAKQNGNTSNIAPISDYVWELIDQFSKPYTYADFTADVADCRAAIEALEVTKHATKVTKDAEGKDVIEDLGVMSTSAWLDDIKADALVAIRTEAAKYNESASKDDLKAAIKRIREITSDAKSDYNAQLKLEGKYDSFFDGFNIVKLLTNFSSLKGLFVNDENQPANPSMLNFNLDFSNPSLSANLDATAYNMVIDILKEAIPKMSDFDATAAKVKVEMNTAGYENKMWVNVTYKEYVVDVLVDIGNCIEAGKLKSSFNVKADITVKIPDEQGTVITYLYAVTANLTNWDKDNGTIVVSFKESDGASVTAASDEFVKVEVTQHWAGEAYRGFSAVLTLCAREKDGSALKAPHVYHVAGLYNADTDMYSFSIEECGITLSAGKFEGDLDWDNTLSYDIPTPSCGFDLGIKMGDKDVTIKVTNLKIANWGSEVTIRGIDTNGKEVIRNTADDKAADQALYEDVVIGQLAGFFYEAK